ncbi:MAG: hypothetical protein ACO28T_06710 [Schleiferiaceae bacterium]
MKPARVLFAALGLALCAPILGQQTNAQLPQREGLEWIPYAYRSTPWRN